jgi:hypothetical protein
MPSASCLCARAASSSSGAVGNGGSIRARSDRRSVVADNKVQEHPLAIVLTDVCPDVGLCGSNLDLPLDLSLFFGGLRCPLSRLRCPLGCNGRSDAEDESHRSHEHSPNGTDGSPVTRSHAGIVPPRLPGLQGTALRGRQATRPAVPPLTSDARREYDTVDQRNSHHPVHHPPTVRTAEEPPPGTAQATPRRRTGPPPSREETNASAPLSVSGAGRTTLAGNTTPAQADNTPPRLPATRQPGQARGYRARSIPVRADR